MKINFFLQSAIIAISFAIISSSNLISLYVKRDVSLVEIKYDFKEAAEQLSLNSTSIKDLRADKFNDTEEGATESLSIGNIHLDSISVNTDAMEFLGNNTIQCITTKNIVELKFKFEFNYKIVHKDKTETKAADSIRFKLVSGNFNYTQDLSSLNYDIVHSVHIKFNYEDDDGKESIRVKQVLKSLLNTDEVLEPVSTQISKRIEENLSKYLNSKEQKKVLPLVLYNNKSYSLSYKNALNPIFFGNGDLIYFMEGEVDPAFKLEDSAIERFLSFNLTDKFANSTFQLFFSKKIFVNLFKLNYEHNLFKIYQADLYSLQTSISELNINWVSQYYPAILNSRPRSDRFYIEYYVNSVRWENNNARVEYTFFFVSTYNLEVVLEFNMSYYFMFKVTQGQNSKGENGINLSITDEDSLKFIEFSLLTPISSRFDKRSFSLVMRNLIVATFKREKFVLFKDFENFYQITFNTFDVRDEGVILANVPKQVEFKKSLKFLN